MPVSGLQFSVLITHAVYCGVGGFSRETVGAGFRDGLLVLMNETTARRVGGPDC